LDQGEPDIQTGNLSAGSRGRVAVGRARTHRVPGRGKISAETVAGSAIAGEGRMTGNLNPLELVLQASIIVQIVMALLLLASIVSWAIMLRKRSELKRARADADRFEEVFWSGGDLTAMFRAIDQSRRVTKGMEAIFEQGFREFTRMRQHGVSPAQLIEGSRRGMRVALLRESDRL